MVRRRRRRVDSAAARPARRGQAGLGTARDLAGLHPHRRPHPERGVGRQADVEPDAAAAAARRGSAGPFWRWPTFGAPRRRRFRPCPGARLSPRRGFTGGVVLARRADPGVARQARSRPRCPRRVSRGRHRARHHHAPGPRSGLAQLVRRGTNRPHRRVIPSVVAQPHPGGRYGPRRARAGSAAGAGPGAATPGRSTIRRVGGPIPRRGRTRRAAAMTTVAEDTRRVEELRLLEAESVHIIREVVAELQRPVLLFSAGKDSIVLLRLAEKAFRPFPLPFPVLHVDTGHNFDEVIEFRDRRLGEHGHRLIVGSVQESIDSGRVPDPGPGASRNRQQTRTLLDALDAGEFDAAFGGARRDEERARAKERILSFRDEFGQWDPRAQRPEPWSLYNGRIKKGEQVRVFPLSNWTELDVWRYIELENLELPSIYFAHEREVVERDGILLAVSEYVQPEGDESSAVEWVRYRTVGDLTITGAVRSTATDIAGVIAEISAATVSERGETRADDRTSVAAMEDRKREGYF